MNKSQVNSQKTYDFYAFISCLISANYWDAFQKVLN